MEDPVVLKKKVCELANLMLKSDEDYLDNVLSIWRTGQRLLGEVWDTEFHVFGVIESDTDHLPLKNVRQHCSAEMLHKSEIELAEIIQHYKKDVTEACNEILAKHHHM